VTFYGLLGFTHNGAKTLTVMGPAIPPGDDVTVQAGAGRLTHYLEKRRGALQGLIAAHGIVVLDKPAWDAKKVELGPAVLD
jgi:hypothetical protein